MHRYRRNALAVFLSIFAVASGASRAQERDRWSIEPSLYVWLPGLTGFVGIGPIDINLDDPSKSLIYLNFAAMGGVRVSYGKWALNTDVVYGNLGASKDNANGNVEELIVEPTLGYHLFPWLEPLAGIRYDRLGGDITGPLGHSTAAMRGWVDPIVGANLVFAVSDSVSIRFRGDVGGFDVGSKLTWQVFPYVSWRVAKIVSLQGGYRVLSVDYENGTGLQRVRYDVIQLGPQFGATFHFEP